jgi:hypothetical protein
VRAYTQPEAFLCFLMGTNKFIELAQSFGVMSRTASVAVRQKLDHKKRLFWREYHGDNMMTLRLSIDHDQWLPATISPDVLDVDATELYIPAQLSTPTPARYEDFVAAGDSDPFIQLSQNLTGEGPAAALAQVVQKQPGSYTQSSVKLIKLMSTYMHIINIGLGMGDRAVDGIVDLFKLYAHSVYKVCGTMVTAPKSFLDRTMGAEEGEERKRGMRPLKNRKAATQGKLASALPDHTPRRTREALSDIRLFPHLSPGVHAMTDQLCEAFDTDAENSLHTMPWEHRFEGLMWDVPSLFTFERRTIVIESLVSLRDFLKMNRERLEVTLCEFDEVAERMDVSRRVERFYIGLVDELPSMRAALYEFAACLIFDASVDVSVRRLERTNWELKELGSDNSAYMTEIVRTLRYLSRQLKELLCKSLESRDAQGRISAEPGSSIVTNDVVNLFWKGLIHNLMHRLVDGICRIHCFTQEGLALMNLDLQVLEQELCQLTDLRPIPEVAFANVFVKGYYLQDESDVLQFIKDHTVRAHLFMPSLRRVAHLHTPP